MLITAPVTQPDKTIVYTPVIEVTYSGTGPDGNADLYVSRYLPHGTTGAAAAQLDQVQFPAVTEDLRGPVANWYQARDAAWSRTGALNVFVSVRNSSGVVTQQPLLYTAAGTPLFTKAIYDKASGFLVLTGVTIPYAVTPASGQSSTLNNTVYVDAATGRVRFSPALNPATQNFARIQATFSPLARRLTTDSRADVAPVTFLDDALKPNDAPGLGNVVADRRWTIWRKSGVAGLTSTSTLYFKTQRLTVFLSLPMSTAANAPANSVDITKPVTVTVNGNTVTGYDLDYLRGRIYFPIALGSEGQQITVTYTDTNGNVHNGTGTNLPAVTDTVQWQDEPLANDLQDALPIDSAAGSNQVIDNVVPIDTATNENNVAAFLDPYAGSQAANGTSLNSHKVWLFWNSTRNGTADIYSETIDPRFAPGP